MKFVVTLAAVERVEAHKVGVEYERLQIGDALTREVRSGDVSEPATYRAVAQELAAAGFVGGYAAGDLRDYRITAECFTPGDRSRFYKAGVSLETLKMAARGADRVEVLEDLVLLCDAQNLVDSRATTLDRAILRQLRHPKRFTPDVIRYLPGRRAWTPNERAFRSLLGMSSKDGPRAQVSSEQIASVLAMTPSLVEDPDVRAAIRQAQQDEHRRTLVVQQELAVKQREFQSAEQQNQAEDRAQTEQFIQAHTEFSNAMDHCRRHALQALTAWGNMAVPPVDQRTDAIASVRRASDVVQALLEQVTSPSFDEAAADLLGGGAS